MIAIEYILAGAAVLVLVSIIANKVSGRLGVPALLIFIIVGMLAGSEGPGVRKRGEKARGDGAPGGVCLSEAI